VTLGDDMADFFMMLRRHVAHAHCFLTKSVMRPSGSSTNVRGRDEDFSPPTGSPEAVARPRLPQVGSRTGAPGRPLDRATFPAPRVARNVRIAQQPKAAFAGLPPSQLPGRAACQLPDQSTIIRVRGSLTDSSRPRGARSLASISRCRPMSA
jgi:hypothetical protein